MRYYTKTGDGCQTQGLHGRCAKSDPQIEAFGALDEAQVALGFAAVCAKEYVVGAMSSSPADAEGKRFEQGECVQSSTVYETLRWMQQVLFDVGGTTCADNLAELLAKTESLCDEFTADGKTKGTKTKGTVLFVLPGSSELSARIDLARVAIRRYERKLCAVADEHPSVMDALPLINRLSDLAYALARTCD